MKEITLFVTNIIKFFYVHPLAVKGQVDEGHGKRITNLQSEENNFYCNLYNSVGFFFTFTHLP